MYDIITIGSATRDVFMMSKAMHPHKAKDVLAHLEACFPFGAKINVDEIHFDTGGGATNNAATFARLGKLRTAAICRIGSDSNGRDIFDVLKKDHIDSQFVQIAKNEYTAYSNILTPSDESGERTILVYRGASGKIEHNIPWAKLKTKWFHLSSLGGDLVLLKKILDHAKKIGAQVTFNPGGQELRVIASAAKQSQRSPRSRRSLAMTLLSRLNFLILNREEAALLTGIPFNKTNDLLRTLLKFSQAAVMTDGPNGAYAVVGKSQIANRKSFKRRAISAERLAYYVPSVGHKAKNRTGAGDAFGSGFITGWIKSKGNLAEALQVGAYNGDSVVQKVGAKNGILEKYPSKSQLAKLPVKKISL